VTKCNGLKIEASDRSKRRGCIELFAEREEKTQIKKWLILWCEGIRVGAGGTPAGSMRSEAKGDPWPLFVCFFMQPFFYL